MLKQIIFIILAVIVTAFVAEYRAYKKQNKLVSQHRREMSILKRDYHELEKLKLSTNQELTRAQIYLKELEIWKAKAIQCSPEIEQLVRTNFAKKEAEKFLTHYPDLESIDTSYENYPFLVEAVEAYNKLSDEAKTQTKINYKTLRTKLDKSFADYIRTTTECMQNADNNLQGIPEHLPQLTKIMEWFNNIPVMVRSEISGTVIISLSMKEAQAKYLTGLSSESISEDFKPDETDGISKFFGVISNGLECFKKKTGNWLKNKYSSIRTWLTKPLKDHYIDIEEDIDENDEEKDEEKD